MVKILSQSGNSLADIYDAEGSVAGIDQLETRELPIVHEMGGTVFSERCSAFIRRATTGALAQNLTWDVTLTDLPSGLYRVLGVLCVANQAARYSQAQGSLRDPLSGREMPFYVWDVNDDEETAIRLVENNAASANLRALRQSHPIGLPTLGVGDGQPQMVGQELVFRGLTSAFGAGTVTITLLIHLAFAAVGGLNDSRGIPIPGW